MNMNDQPANVSTQTTNGSVDGFEEGEEVNSSPL